MAHRTGTSPQGGPFDLGHAIMALALEQAERTGWEGLRLHDVAAALDISLADLYRHFREADAIAESWLTKADQAMLGVQDPSFAGLGPTERIERVILLWLDTLAPHRAVTRQILVGKLYPGHPHFVASLLVRLSRTVQWVREAALLRGGPPRRQIVEIALTWLFVATVASWCVDGSQGQQRTRRFLARRLRDVERLQAWCPRAAARSRSSSAP
jgi:AcrR family transcriptional regulator